jgi:hypothetical protein
VEKKVEHRPTVFTGPPAGESSHQFLGIHFDIDDMVNRFPHLGKDGLESLGLGNRSWKSIEDKTWIAIRCPQPLIDDTDDNLVWDKLPLVHKRLGFFSQVSSFLHGSPENIPSGDLRDVITVNDYLCLRPFSRPWRA